MKFHHEFTVPLGIDDAWRTLGDIERLGPYLPGTRLRQGPGNSFSGDTSFRMGPVSVKYTGTGTVMSRDAARHIAVMEAKGVSADGRKSLRGTVTARLVEMGPKQTRVLLDTDVKLGAAAASMGAAKASQMGTQFLGNVSAGLADQLRRRAAGSTPARPAADTAEDATFRATTPPGNLAAGGIHLTKQPRATGDSETGRESAPPRKTGPHDAGQGASSQDTSERDESATRQAASAGARRAREAMKNPQVAGAVGLAAGALATLASRRGRN